MKKNGLGVVFFEEQDKKDAFGWLIYGFYGAGEFLSLRNRF